ncbi:MAG: hypothetical protein ACKV2T_10470 [Kofleriaceae bacterium]
MSFRDDLAAAHARIEALERENAELRAELERLTGRVRTQAPEVVARRPGEKLIWIGARIQCWQFPHVIYTGESVDDECILRRANLWQREAFDLLLAPNSAAFVARIGDAVIAQLDDLRLVAMSTTGNQIAALQLSERLIARPFSADRWIACLTESGEILHVDPAEWRVIGSEPYRSSAHRLPTGHPDGCHAGFDHELVDDAGWRITGTVPDGGEIILALSRNLGKTEMAIARAPTSDGKPLVPRWLTRIDFGDPWRLYVVDNLAVIHSSGVTTHIAAGVDRDGSIVFVVEGALGDAKLRMADGRVFAI